MKGIETQIMGVDFKLGDKEKELIFRLFIWANEKGLDGHALTNFEIIEDSEFTYFQCTVWDKEEE